eukprot:COSAG02_NODE_4395_length_5409_cov_3.368738_8_plen_56_part_00
MPAVHLLIDLVARVRPAIARVLLEDPAAIQAVERQGPRPRLESVVGQHAVGDLRR